MLLTDWLSTLFDLQSFGELINSRMPLSHERPHTEYVQAMRKFFGTISIIIVLTSVGVPGTLGG